MAIDQEAGDISSRPLSAKMSKLPPLASTTEPPVFTVFPKLPAEMQNEIWKHSCPLPRVIGIRVLSLETPTSPWVKRIELSTLDQLSLENAGHKFQFSTYDAPSPLLSVCKASRNLVLKAHYTVCLQSAGSKRKIRFRANDDTIFLDNHNYPYLPALAENPHSKIHTTLPRLYPFAGVNKVILTLSMFRSWAMVGNNDDITTDLGFLSLFDSLETLIILPNGYSLPPRRSSLPQQEIELRTLEDCEFTGDHKVFYPFLGDSYRNKMEGHIQKMIGLMGENWKPPQVKVMLQTRNSRAL